MLSSQFVTTFCQEKAGNNKDPTPPLPYQKEILVCDLDYRLK